MLFHKERIALSWRANSSCVRKSENSNPLIFLSSLFFKEQKSEEKKSDRAKERRAKEWKSAEQKSERVNFQHCSYGTVLLDDAPVKTALDNDGLKLRCSMMMLPWKWHSTVHYCIWMHNFFCTCTVCAHNICTHTACK